MLFSYLSGDAPLPGLDPTKIPQRVFISQVVFSVFVGFIGFILFCYLRPNYPQIYSLRSLRRSDIDPLPDSFWKWISIVFLKVDEEEVLTLSGLDAYVFLCFFKISIKIFAILTLVSVTIIAPIMNFYESHDSDKISLYVYAIFTDAFVYLSVYLLLKETKNIIKIRQKYLGSQNSITDKTIKISGIPHHMRTRDSLRKHINDLGIGRVAEIHFNMDWDVLDHYFKQRDRILDTLENAYIKYYGTIIDIHKGEMPKASLNMVDGTRSKDKKRPIIRVGRMFDFKKVDLINYYLIELKQIDYAIEQLRSEPYKNFKPTDSAFVTMDSVASAQMLAQAVLDPKVGHLLPSLAPAPSDVIWSSFSVPKFTELVQNYCITITFAITSVVLIFPVSSLAALINVETITRFCPSLGRIIAESKWLTTLVTGLLPPTLFTLLNVCIPYLYSYMSTKQYFYSTGAVELASVRKNFFYTFFNLFLVFTIAGSASNFWSYFTDTRKIAFQLAQSIKKLSLFYTDLIVLQALGIFPYKLLQAGDIFIISFYNMLHFCKLKTIKPLELRYLYYTPKIFDFGLILPQHILIFMITLIYSVISTKLLACGLLYFIIGYFVYKYQLVYSMIHPQNSTGKVWELIIHRILLGLALFILTMVGTLALENSFWLACFCFVPSVTVLGWFYFTFEKYYAPLLYFIALRVIVADENGSLLEDVFDDTDINASINSINNNCNDEQDEPHDNNENIYFGNRRRRRSTFDELRDNEKNYTYLKLTDPLRGPQVGFEGNLLEIIDYSDAKLIECNDDVDIDVRTVDMQKLKDFIVLGYAGERIEGFQGSFYEWE